MAPQKQPAQFVFQLEIRPEKRKSPEFRLLVEALLAAAREELEWEKQQKKTVPAREARGVSQ
jgi:hypothetical protein